MQSSCFSSKAAVLERYEGVPIEACLTQVGVLFDSLGPGGNWPNRIRTQFAPAGALLLSRPGLEMK
jgi:hypothetical protein